MKFPFGFAICALIVFLLLKPVETRKPEISPENILQKHDESNMALTHLSEKSPTSAAPHDQILQHNIKELFEKKDFHKALEFIEEKLVDRRIHEKTKKWLRAHLPVIYLSIGYDYLGKNQCAKALPYLEKSHEITTNKSTLKALAFCHKDIGDQPRAVFYVDQARKNNIYDLELLKLHKEIMESEQRLDLTRDYYNFAKRDLEAKNKSESVNKIKKEQKEINKKLAESKNQISFRSNHFFMRYNNSIEANLADKTLEFLDDKIQALVGEYMFNLPKSQIEVVLYKFENFYEANNNSPLWAAALYDGRLRIPIKSLQKFDEQYKIILSHELVHALLAEIKQRRHLPTWIEEGLAQLISCTNNCRSVVGKKSGNTFLTKITLEDTFLKLTKRNSQRAYQQSLYILLYIANDYTDDIAERIVEAIRNLKVLSSDEILNFTINTDFTSIYNGAKDKWNRGVSYSFKVTQD